MPGEELLPCPFCGGSNVELYRTVLDETGEPRWFVYCKDQCGSGYWTENKKKSVIAWNRRPGSETARALEQTCLDVREAMDRLRGSVRNGEVNLPLFERAMGILDVASTPMILDEEKRQ